MKKFLLVVNTTVFIILLSYILFPSKIVAQTQTISPSQLGQGNSNPLSLLQELLKILFSFSSTGPGGPPPPVPSGYPPISGLPPPTSGYVYYPQCGVPFGTIPLPGGCTLCNAGCGPTTVAMMLASYVDRNINPQFVVDYYKNNGYSLDCGGSGYVDAKATLQVHGLQTTDYLTYPTATVDQVANDFKGYLRSGWTLFAFANFCYKTEIINGVPVVKTCPHLFWITEIDDSNNVWAYDPYYGIGQTPPVNLNRYYPFPKYRVAFGVKR